MANVNKQNKRLDLIFAGNAKDLLFNVRTHLEKEKLQVVSLNVVRECNNFCALVTGEPRQNFIGM